MTCFTLYIYQIDSSGVYSFVVFEELFTNTSDLDYIIHVYAYRQKLIVHLQIRS